MSAPRVNFVDFLDPLERVDPASGQARVRVGLEGGRESVFLAATFDRPEAWMKERKLDHWFDELVLYVRRLDTPTVRAAVEASSPEPGGYRLRYYRAAPGAPSSCGVGKAWTDLGNGGCGAAETILKDGRDSPSSPPPSGGAPSSRAAACALLRPHGLFVKLDAAHASARRPYGGGRRAAFLLTPRKTRPRILDSFRPRTLTAAPRPNLRRPSLWLCAA